MYNTQSRSKFNTTVKTHRDKTLDNCFSWFINQTFNTKDKSISNLKRETIIKLPQYFPSLFIFNPFSFFYSFLSNFPRCSL